jgi:lantibiotic modifying enzyme
MSATDRTPLELATAAGEWLGALAVEEGDGFRWPVAAESPFSETSTAGLASGGAGIGRFLLDLHRETGEARSRDLACGAARRITGWAPELYEGIGPDLLDGAAGVGRLLTALCQEGEDFLEEARRLGHWLLARAERFRGTGFGYGRAGIGDVLLGLGTTCEEEAFLDAARETARWLDRVSHVPGQGLRAWGPAGGTRWTDVTWARGTAGVVTFLLNLHETTGDGPALTSAREALAWLARSAESVGEGRVCWPVRIGTEPHQLAGQVARCTGPGFGMSGVAEVFLKAWRVTGDDELERVARSAIGWVLDRAEETPDGGFRWPYAEGLVRYDAGLLGGIAGIGSALTRFHESFPDADYGAAASRAARHLEAVAEEPDGAGLAWWDVLEVDDPVEKRFHRTGLAAGAAGIGTFLLQLHGRGS